MYRVYVYKSALAAVGAAMITLGIIIVCQREILLTPLTIIGGTVLLLHGFHNGIDFITHGGKLTEKRRKVKLLTSVINIIFGIAVIMLRQTTIFIVILVFGIYVLLNAASKLADFIVARINHQNGRWAELIQFLFFATFAVLLFFSNQRNDMFLIVSGIYCILFGAELLSDFIGQMIPQKAKNRLKRHIRISPPVFISTFMPLGTLRYINEYISLNDKEPPFAVQESNENAPPDIEVMVHVSNNGSGKIGHLDVFFDGEIISYGNHDHASHKLFSVFGDGILFTAEKKRYLEFSVTHDRKMIFSYGLRLNPEQIEAVREEVRKLKSMTVPWKPPFQEAYEQLGENARITDYHDYCSVLWNGTHADFFKFRKGKFKTYSILSTNCVLLTDSIIGKAGADIVCITGIASPGIYYDYLERLYMAKNSMVISKTIYDRKNMRKTRQERNNDNE